MNCPQCGTQTQDGAQFCPQCGAPLSCEITQQPVPADAYQQPEAAAAGDQFAQAGQPQSPYAQSGNPAGIEDKSTMFIVLSVLEFFFAGGLIAIWPFVMSLNYKSAIERGDVADAQAKRKSARTALIVTLILGIVFGIIVILLIVALCLAAAGTADGVYQYSRTYSF